MTEAKDADTWTQIVAPLVARCEVAAAFNAEAVWGPKGAAGLGGVLKRMAEIIDDEIEARGAREHRIESEDDTRPATACARRSRGGAEMAETSGERPFTALEEFVLLAIVETAPESYGAVIANKVPHASVGGVYRVLETLERRGVLTSAMLPSEPRRGGRRRKSFAISKAGMQVLRSAVNGARRRADGMAAIVAFPSPPATG